MTSAEEPGIQGTAYAARTLPGDTVIAKYGLAARWALIALPTENTHGYEVIHQDAIEACARVLAAHLAGAPSPKSRRRRSRPAG